MASDLWRDVFFPETVGGKEGGAAALAGLKNFQNCCVAEYVWLDGNGATRSKVKTMDKTPSNADDCTIWTYNGAATDQAKEESSDVYLVPRKVFMDPMRGAPHVMVICECITQAMEPAKGNFRAECAEIMEKNVHNDPWFGLEQEYVLCDESGAALPVANKDSCYCGRGAMNLPRAMREIMGDHYAQCLAAGIKVSGMNCEAGAAQGEFQIGPCKGLNAGDHLIAARHTLHKCATKYRVSVSFKGMHESGVKSGLHLNFSTKHTRAERGLAVIEKMCRVLDKQSDSALAVYGDDVEARCDGQDSCANVKDFNFALADRSACIRIPRSVGIVAKGYLEDRRPSANADPYRITAYMMKTCAEALRGL